MARIRKAVFPVGGLGTRFLPVTKSVPKEMLPVCNKPLIQYAFEEARNAGIEEFIFVTGHNKSAINEYFYPSYGKLESFFSRNKEKAFPILDSWLPPTEHITFITQQEPLGLGDAVNCASTIVGNEPFVVILADEIIDYQGGFLSEMIELHDKTHSNIIAIAEVDNERTNRYGIISPGIKDIGIKINDMVEKPSDGATLSNLAIIGRYILYPEIFYYLNKIKPDTRGEIQLTDAMREMLKVQDFYGLEFKGARFDCGDYLGYLEANIAYTLQDKKLAPQALKYLKKYANA